MKKIFILATLILSGCSSISSKVATPEGDRAPAFSEDFDKPPGATLFTFRNITEYSIKPNHSFIKDDNLKLECFADKNSKKETARLSSLRGKSVLDSASAYTVDNAVAAEICETLNLVGYPIGRFHSLEIWLSGTAGNRKFDSYRLVQAAREETVSLIGYRKDGKLVKRYFVERKLVEETIK